MTTIKPGSVLGIIGGGQLGRMTALAAASLGLKVHIFSDHKDSPASHVSNKTIVAPYTNKKALEKFIKEVDIVTFEFENIPAQTVHYLADHVQVRPSAHCLEIAQHRLREKDFLNQHGIPTAEYRKVTSAQSFKKAFKEIGPECILKTVEFGYDGKGQHSIDENTDLAKLWHSLKLKTAILEKRVPFEKEISVMIARDVEGATLPYTPSENIHRKGILDISIVPANISDEILDNVWSMADDIAEKLDLVGILAIEFFLTKEQTLLVNELAPRPHNSGHWTTDACVTGQFEQFVRAVCGWPLGSTHCYTRALMKNLIGDEVELWKEFINDPDSKIHLYGKKEALPGRKMGHVTHLIGDEDELVSL